MASTTASVGEPDISGRGNDVSRAKIHSAIDRLTQWLEKNDYETILLDHDLTEEHYYSDAHDDEGTGYAIASWLAAHPESQPDATIVVHSLNYVGAKRMLDIMRAGGRNAEHVPFPYLQAGLIIRQ